MQTLISATAWVGYWIGIGIELGIIVICGVLLALMLTGVLFEWIDILGDKIAESKAKREEEKRRKAEEKAEAEARAEAEAAAAAEAEVYEDEEGEAAESASETAAASAEGNAEVSEATATAEAKPEESAAAEEEPKAESKKGKKKPKRGKKDEEAEVNAEAEGETAAAGAATGSAGDSKTEVVYVQGEGVVFAESKTITELYEELSSEQKGYFDELREEALRKPDAELSISRNFIAVKIGKRNLIKLLIKRGVTVAEFILENEQLKQLRLSDKNKRGKSAIKVKPTTVQVLDLPSLKVAVDMITLAYEELMLGD